MYLYLRWHLSTRARFIHLYPYPYRCRDRGRGRGRDLAFLCFLSLASRIPWIKNNPLLITITNKAGS